MGLLDKFKEIITENDDDFDDYFEDEDNEEKDDKEING